MHDFESHTANEPSVFELKKFLMYTLIWLDIIRKNWVALFIMSVAC